MTKDGQLTDDEIVTPVVRRRLGSGVAVLVTLLLWAAGAWFSWSYAVGVGGAAGMDIRTGTMTVTSCTRQVEYAFWLYACDGDTVFAPESTWSGIPPKPDGHTIQVLSSTRLAGQVEFVTYDPSRSTSRNFTETAVLSNARAYGRTWQGFLSIVGVGAAWLVGGVLVGMHVHRVRAIWH